MKYFGALVPVVTPCSRKGEIDTEGLKNTVLDMYNNGCCGMMVCGSTGRGPWFSRRDRQRICSTVRDTDMNSVVLAGCMAAGLEPIIENCRAMADAGADIAVITAPYYFKYNSSELEQIFTEIADHSPIPILLYDIPDFTGTGLDTNLLLKLASHQNIAGLKDSSHNTERFSILLKSLAQHDNLYLFQGKEPLLFKSLLEGASGLVVSLMHIHPRPFTLMLEKVAAGKTDEAAKIQEKISEVYNIVSECLALSGRPETSTLFFILDYCLRKRNICNNILLEHEGNIPGWLADKAETAITVFNDCLEENGV